MIRDLIYPKQRSGITESGWVRGHSVGWFRFESEYEDMESGIDLWVNHPKECFEEEEVDGRVIQYANCALNYALEGQSLEELHVSYMESPGMMEEPPPWMGSSSQGVLPIEYWVSHGWHPAGPWGPEEYEFALVWRVVREGRDEDLADA